MKFLRHRHLMQCALAFLLTFYLLARRPAIGGFFVTAALAAAGICAVIFAFRRNARSAQVFFVFLCILLAALRCYDVYGSKYRSVLALAGQSEQVQIVVIGQNTDLTYKSEYDVQITRANGTSFHAILTCPYPSDYARGTTLTGNVTFSLFEPTINGYPEQQYQLSRGYLLAADAENELTITGNEDRPSFYFARARDALGERIDRSLSPNAAGLARCLITADRTALDPVLKRDFSRLGLSHLLAMSGLHLSIIIGGLYALLTLLTVPKYVKNALVMLFVFVFMALTGFPASLTRAGCMTIITMSCLYLGKKPDPASALCFATAIICAVDAYAIFDLGLQLSFAATLGIVTLSPLIRRRLMHVKHLPRKVMHLIEALYICAAALTFTLPFTAFSYRVFSISGIFATLLFAPLITVLLYALPLLLIFAEIPFVDTTLVFLCEHTTELVARLTNTLSQFAFPVSLYYPFALWLIIAFCIFLCILLLCAPKKPLVWMLPLLSFSILIYSGVGIYSIVNSDTARAYVCTVYKNDCLALRRSNAVGILDISDATAASGARALYLAERELYATQTDYYIFVNYYNKTSAYLLRLIEQHRVGCVYLPADAAGVKLADLTEIAQKYGVTVVPYRYGETFSAGGMEYLIDTPLYLRRSARPIHKITVNTGKETFCYLGAAFSEADTDTPACDITVAGTYGPLYKKPFSYTGHVYMSGIPAEFSKCENQTVYESDTQIILNND